MTFAPDGVDLESHSIVRDLTTIISPMQRRTGRKNPAVTKDSVTLQNISVTEKKTIVGGILCNEI